MLWLWLKALHIVFVVTWFAGLFYIVRLFIYHAEAPASGHSERPVLVRQYRLMERRLWYGITWPSMVLTTASGTWLAFGQYGLDVPAWLLAKLALVAGLIGYHLICHRLFTAFQRDACTWTSFRLRLWNEAATFFLAGIVFLAVLKSSFDYAWGSFALLLLAALLAVSVFLYRRQRRNLRP